jgi:hypothetical protein
MYQEPYVPEERIISLLKSIIPAFEPLISLKPFALSPSEHILGTTSIGNLLQAPIVNWHLNRPPDPARCLALSQYLARSKEGFDLPMIMAYQHLRGQFDVLDGIHRWRALQLLAEAYPTHPLLYAPIQLNIRTNASEGQLIEAFQNINKSIPVPDLYLRDTTKDRRDCIERLAIKWQARYPSHFKTTKAPQKPNTNRDLFIEFLDGAYTALQLTFETQHLLEARMEEMNAALRQSPLTDKVRQLCEITGCYLFTKKLGELEAMVKPT